MFQDKDTQVPLAIAVLQLGNKLLQFGNREVQIRMANHLRKPRQVDFFHAAHRYLLDATSAVRTAVTEQAGRSVSASFDPMLTGTLPRIGVSRVRMTLPTVLIHFLQLWSEGHNYQMQDLLREQPDHRKHFNLIDDGAHCLFRGCWTFAPILTTLFFHAPVTQLLIELTRDKQCLCAMGRKTFALLQACMAFLLEVVEGDNEATAKNKRLVAEQGAAINALHQVLLSVWIISVSQFYL